MDGLLTFLEAKMILFFSPHQIIIIVANDGVTIENRVSFI
jgi:hypothetical protein